MSRVRLSSRPRSARQVLREYAENGRLRDALERGYLNDQKAIDLCVNVVLRYCEPRPRRYHPRLDYANGRGE